MVADSVIILAGFLVWTIIVAPSSVWMNRYLHRYLWDIKKVWSVSVNGNNGLGTIQLVNPTKDGLKTKTGIEIPTELNFAFKERVAGNPIFIWDEDTGMLMRPFSGEVEMSDPVAKNSKEIGEHIDRIKSAGDNFPWLPAILVVGILGLIGLVVLGFMFGGKS